MKITIEFSSLEELLAFNTRGFAQEPVAPTAEEPTPAPVPLTENPSSAATAPAKKRGRPAKALPPVEAPQEPAAPVQAETAPAQDDGKAPGAPPTDTPAALPAAAAPITEAEARTALETVFEAKGFAGAQELLSKLGAQRLRDVPADKYGELVALARGMLA